VFNVKKNYKLLRAEENNGTYIPIATFQNYTALKLVYIDNIDVTKVWCYKLSAVDQCGNYMVESNIARNINISVTSNEDATQTIVWSTYFNWRGGVEKYNIFRIVDNQPPVLAGTTFMDTSFVDDIAFYSINRTGVSGKFCYYIEAVEGDFNPYEIKGISKSNISCATQFSRVFIPNTFTPNGDVLNAEFLPIISFIDPTKYKLKIFDRWGEIIFESSDPLKGWDGKKNGNKVPGGNYVYTLVYTDNSDNKKEKSGYVFLFYP
jgi:gliding motility-associated-like protein